MITFASPWWFLALLAIILRIAVLRADRVRVGFRFSSIALARSRTSLRSALAWLPFALEVIGLTLIVVALARPQRIERMSDERNGIDIVIALDASGSMAAEDFHPRNRFTVAKDLIAEFIDRRVDDRIGIVTFGQRAATRVPVTFDRDVAKAILGKADIGDNGDGTAIGHAIATSVNRLRSSKARSRVIILVTDGVNNAGSIAPAPAAALAKRYGIRIYSVGIGKRGAVPIRIRQQNRLTGQIESVYQIIRGEIDEELLEAVAETTGGAFFRAPDPRALEDVLASIDRLERSRFTFPSSWIAAELFGIPLSAGILVLIVSLIAGETVWMRLPA